MIEKNWYNSKGEAFSENELVTYLSVTKNGVVFLSGPSTCGKSRTVKQVKEILESDIKIVSEEYITNVIVKSITSGKSIQDTFINKLSEKVLVIEDVDLLSGKEATQLEVGNIIKELKNKGKMIVLTGINLIGRISFLIKMLQNETVDFFDYL